MPNLNFETAKILLHKNIKLDYDKSFALAQYCSTLLSNAETETIGRDIVIRALNSMHILDPKTHAIWNDIVESSGLNPYVKEELLSGPGLVRVEFFRSNAIGKTFHDEQMKIAQFLLSSKSVIVSAPTSFGKSLLIEEIVARNKYNNIVIIQPTLALLDETRKNLNKYSPSYDIILTTSQKPTRDRNLFLFTGERAAEYKHFPKIDFFVIDEFYKLSQDRDDERAATLNFALYKLLKMTKTFYMLGPSIDNVNPNIIEKTGAVWIKTNYATVAVDMHSIVTNVEIGGREAAVEAKEIQLFNLLKNLSEPTLIYCSSPDKINKLVPKFLNFFSNSGIKIDKIPNSFISEVVEWTKDNVHEGWHFTKALSSFVGIHHGALPRHLSSAVVDLFNHGHIRYLFCTSTLIEGVNTSAKNVILYDRHKGGKPIDYFDFKNIAGRSGRMNRHFVGQVFQFHAEPKETQLAIDLPLFSQDKAPLDLLIQLDHKDITKEGAAALSLLNTSTENKEIMKKNLGVPIEGQLALIQELSQFATNNLELISWTTVPKYNQLSYILDLGWRHLLKKSEGVGGAFSSKQLAVVALQYYHKKSLKPIIVEQLENEYWVKKIQDRDLRLQTIIHLNLQISRHWFGYKLPKMLAVISTLQEYVLKKMDLVPGNYAFFAKAIENRMLPDHLATLIDYGVPASAIIKIGTKYKSDIPLPELISKLKKDDLSTLKLIPYELRKIKSI